MDDVRSNLAKRFPKACFEAASAYASQRKLASGVPEIDAFLAGGLPVGKVTEFGMPLGREGRTVLLQFLIRATRGAGSPPLWCLWVSSHQNLEVYPPAWYARGVAPGRIVFADSQAPTKDLKRAIVSPFFGLIVLDAPKEFAKNDCLFVNVQARRNRQAILLVRDFFLSNSKGNVWSALRINCSKRHARNQFVLRAIRGLSDRELCIDGDLLQ